MRSVPADGHRSGQHRARAVRHPAARHRSARADSSRRSATVSSTPPKQLEAILHIRDRPARGQRINGAIADTATRSATPAIDPVLAIGWGAPPPSPAGAPVAVHPVPGRTAKIPAMHPYRRPPALWPLAGTATAVVAASGLARAGDLPVWVGPPVSARGTLTSAAGPPVSRVQVSMAGHAAASAAGVHGVVFSVARADGGDAAARMHVSVDYSSFAHAYGGDYAARLRLPVTSRWRPRLMAASMRVMIAFFQSSVTSWT